MIIILFFFFFFARLKQHPVHFGLTLLVVSEQRQNMVLSSMPLFREIEWGGGGGVGEREREGERGRAAPSAL